MIVERKNFLKQNNTGVLKIKNYTFERAENFKYFGAILNADNNPQTHLQERNVCILYQNVHILYIHYKCNLQVHMPTSGIVIHYTG